MLLLAATLAPDQWPQFRGPDASGVAEDARLPERWSQTENVAWKTDIPGLGWSSPVVWGDRIFVTSVIPLVEQEKPRTGIYLDGRRVNPPPGEHRWMVYCIDFNTGEIRWAREVHRGTPKSARHLKNSFASETPVTDGERVYAYFGNVGVFAFDMGGHPLRIRQAAAIFRERSTSLDGWASNIAPESLITEWMASIDEKQRRALLTLAALPGVPLHALHVAGIAELPDIEPSLMTLVRRGLVVSSQSRHQLADGVGDRLRRTEDLKPWLNRAITYYTAWVERYRRKPDNLLEESEALLRVQQYATDARRWGEALRLGQLLEGALVAGARWDAWALTLEHSLTAAKAIGDRSAEA